MHELHSAFSSDHSKNIFRTHVSSFDACEDCAEPVYPSEEITSQCTDKCIIVACSNPDHIEVDQCHASLSCDGSMDCGEDCGSFNELLQCCTDYYAYTPELKNVDQLSSNLCACDSPGIISPTKTYVAIDPTGHIQDIPLSNISRDETIQPTSPLSSHITSYYNLQSHNENAETPTCMWGNCQASFNSMAELVGHVNLEHLRPRSSPALQTDSTASSYSLAAPQLGCQWRDCTSHLFPESITEPSTGDQIDGVLDYLATHLLNDHLGAHDDTRESRPARSISPQTPTISSDISPTLSDDSLLDAKAYKCGWQFCELSFDNCEDLTSHISTVHIGSGKAQYECFWKGCSRNSLNGFSSRQKICRHLQSHTGHRPFQCSVCRQYFSEAATLQQHMRRHTREKPYVCDYPGCGKSFAITGALTIHKRTHNGQKPFKCSFCERAFAESSNLSKHLRTHTGARPYHCSEPGCSKSFARPDQLTRHLGIHRKKSPCSE